MQIEALSMHLPAHSLADKKQKPRKHILKQTCANFAIETAPFQVD